MLSLKLVPAGTVFIFSHGDGWVLWHRTAVRTLMRVTNASGMKIKVFDPASAFSDDWYHRYNGKNLSEDDGHVALALAEMDRLVLESWLKEKGYI